MRTPLDAGSPKAIEGSWPGSQASVVLRYFAGNRASFFFPLKTNKKIYIYIYLFFHVELRQNKSV